MSRRPRQRPDYAEVYNLDVRYRLNLRRIRASMVELAFSVNELAETAHVHRSTISRLLAGRGASISMLAAILAPLGLVPGDVLEELSP